MPKYRRQPRRTDRICSFPACRIILPTNAPATTTRCHIHQDTWQAESKRFLHSAAWLRARAAKLAETPWCEQCQRDNPLSLEPATQVDHIKPRHSHRDLWLTPSNLQSLCDRCHGEKTGRGE